MTSKEIRFFGFMISLLLVLFIVLFFGKNLYKIVHAKAAMAHTSVPVPSEVSSVESSIHKEKKELKKIVQVSPDIKTKQKETKQIDLKVIEQKVLKKKQTVSKEKATSQPDINVLIKNLVEKGNFFRQSNLLQEDDKIILNRVINLLKSLTYPYKIEVEGYTQEGVASDVSIKMAGIVGRYLKSALSDVEIQTKGYGSQYPISGDIYSNINRRINILVRRK